MSDQTTAPWYKNVSTLSHIFNALVGLATSVGAIATNDFHSTLPGWLPKVGGILLTLAGGLGIYDNHS